MGQGDTGFIHKDTGEGTILIFPWFYSAVAQGTWIFSISTSFAYNGHFYNSSNVVGDQLDFKVWLSAGIWHCNLLCISATSIGKYHLLLDSVKVATLDPYAVDTYWIGFEDPIYVATTGLKTLSIQAALGISNSAYLYTQALQLVRAR